MGLDIYAHLVKKSVSDKSSNNEEIHANLRKNAVETYHKTTTKLLKELYKEYEKCSPIEYAKVYNSFIEKLKRRVPLYKQYSFYLDKFGYDYREKTITSVKEPKEVEQIITEEEKHIYAITDAYFRKVNFIYQYFRGKLEDEECIVSKFELNEFIQVCKDVYKHKGDEDYATENLPTTSGFFFGSTAYDDWYWNDVKDCIKQMEKLYKKLDDEDSVLWCFSW